MIKFLSTASVIVLLVSSFQLNLTSADTNFIENGEDFDDEYAEDVREVQRVQRASGLILSSSTSITSTISAVFGPAPQKSDAVGTCSSNSKTSSKSKKRARRQCVGPLCSITLPRRRSAGQGSSLTSGLTSGLLPGGQNLLRPRQQWTQSISGNDKTSLTKKSPNESCGLLDVFARFCIHYVLPFRNLIDYDGVYKAFCRNVHLMDLLNRGPLTHRKFDDAICGINSFAYIPTENFAKIFCRTIPEKGALPLRLSAGQKRKNRKARAATVDKLDWRDFGVMPPIRNQKSCGSCYAFAVSDLVSVQYAIQNNKLAKGAKKTKDTLTLSAQYVMDCLPDDASMGCRGGRPYRAMQYIALSNEGLPLEYCEPYLNKEDTCPKGLKCCERRKILKTRMYDVTGPSEREVMSNLLQLGPVIAVVDANEFWQFHNGTGIIKDYQCSSSRQNHAVLLVGYDFTGATPYYIVRNSWNNDWGDNGYAKLQAGTNACSVAKSVIAACAKDCENFVEDTRKFVDQPNATRG